MIVAFMAGMVFGAIVGCLLFASLLWAAKELNETNPKPNSNQKKR